MCDDEAGLVLHQLDECTLDTVLGADINRAGSLVENEHRRVHEHYTRDADELLLSLREPAVLGDDRVVALRQTLDEAVSVYSLCGFYDLFARGSGNSVRDVFGDSAGENPCFLQYHAEAAAEAVAGDGADISAGNRYPAAVYIVEAEQEVDYRGFSAARRSDDSNALTGSDVEVEVLNQLHLGVIREAYVFECELAGAVPELFHS